MYKRRLYKKGNSLALNIPKELLRALRVKEGTEIIIKQIGNKLILSSRDNYLADDVDLKFIKMIEEFADEHENVLRELAKR